MTAAAVLRWLAATAAAALLLALAGGGVAVLLRPAPATGTAATEHWYSVRIDDRRSGFARLAVLERADAVEFSAEVSVRLPGSDQPERQWQEILTFDRHAPWQLRSVRRDERQALAMRRMRLQRDDGPDGVPRLTGLQWGAGAPRPRVFSGAYTLHDHLGLERWLASGPATGARIRVTSLDTAELRLDTRDWRLAGRDASQLRLTGARGRLRMDIEPLALLPTRMSLGGGLELRREPAGLARLLDPPADRSAVIALADPAADPSGRHRARYAVLAPRLLIPDAPGQRVTWTGQQLEVHVDHRALTLPAGPAGWPGSAAGDDDAGTGADADDAAARFLQADDSAPHDLPALQALARAALAGHGAGGPDRGEAAPDPDATAATAVHAPASSAAATGDAAVTRLVHFVHHFLTWDDDADPLAVEDLLTDRRGDCTEFAALFTTLARAAGLPARSVSGLAWDPARRGFALHAWNEVLVDGRWRGADPTWDQPWPDAGHIRLTSHPDDLLALDGEWRRIRIALLAADPAVATTGPAHD